MCLFCSDLLPAERPPCQSRLASYAQVEALARLGVSRGESLTMTPEEAQARLAVAVRDRWIDTLLQAPSLERARAA